MAEDISAASLYAAIEQGTVPELLDMRNPEEMAAVPFEGPRDVPIRSAPLWRVLDDLPGFAATCAPGTVLLCAHGNGSALVAEEFEALGTSVRSLAAGMGGWSELLVTRELPLPAGSLQAWQLLRPAKGCLSYLIGVPGQRCLVVDPARQLTPYLDLAAERGMQITHVVDTHLHADHISGGPRLAELTGARYSLPAADAATLPWPTTPLQDGDVISLGEQQDVRIWAVELPGHTPGTTAVVVEDVLVAAGDTLFVRGVGRPDLTGRAEELAQALFSSIHDRLATMNPDAWLLPAHWSNRAELRPDGTVRVPLGEVLAGDLLTTLNADEFIAQVLASLPPAPASYERIRAVNAGAAANPEELDVLEVGRNQCAAGSGVRN